MDMAAQQEKARRFRSLYENGILVLPNAWDAGSAVLIERAGAKAIATTSAGVSWGLGRGDGQQLTREQMVELIARIVEVVEVPVSADIEGGYGPEPAAVAETVRAIVGAGAIGVNLEDSRSTDWTLHTPREQAARIAAGRGAAVEAGLPELVINARTDVYLLGIGAETGRVDDVLHRAETYAAAGADTLFVPGLTDLATLGLLVKGSPIPITVMAGPGAPSVDELADAGIKRVTVGGMIAQAAYTLVVQAAEEILTLGTYATLNTAGSFAGINDAFRRA
ncbi:isocitrate lyase/PEP mutase family protein [Actinoplanes sp. HUAS TT8]|uniref:isocitrate lyase/PEP mutase family protein n=1 Tax=Actinoplanes sp. HUAS TT8 TaxID=3447453 RepID=UPI003F51FF7C